MSEVPLNLLIVPLLAGYYFASQARLTAWYTARQSGERLILLSSLFGLAFFVLGRVAAIVISQLLPTSIAYWRDFASVPYSGSAIASFLIALVFTFLANRLISRKRAVDFIMARSNNALETLFYYAVSSQHQIQITLTDGKAYVGYIYTNPLQRRVGMAYIEIVPTLSGYREPVTKKLIFITSYAKAYLKLGKNGTTAPDLTVKDFMKVIPLSVIQTASIFDPVTYDEFNVSTKDKAAGATS